MDRRSRTCLVAVLTLAGGIRAAGLEGSVTDIAGRPLHQAVVHLGAIEGRTFEAPSVTRQIDQRGLRFRPHVLVVQAGTRVEFLNSDMLLHNVFSPPGCEEGFQLGTWPTGQSRSWTFDRPCTAVLLCNVHPEMEAYVVVTETPYFSITDEAGRYSIPDVPGGTHRIIVWHERHAPSVETVAVADSLRMRRDFRLSPLE